MSPERILELSALRERGIAVALKHPKLFLRLFQLLWGLKALKPSAQRRVMDSLAAGNLSGVCRVLTQRSSFRRRGTWALFWSLTDASMKIADAGLSNTHEPELNGAFMALIAQSIAEFPAFPRGSNAAVVIGDHATLGNEARTGSDFGLILEMEHGGEVRYLVTLLQAKRATAVRTSVHRPAGESTQLELLVNSGIGSYLFYHAHNDPTGLGPTVRDAHAVQANPSSAPVLSADDFAARLAVAADNLFAGSAPHALPGMGAPGSRDDALKMLFNPNIPGLRVNDVLVARLGNTALPSREVVDFETEWRDRVSNLKEEVARARGEAPMTREDREDREPPLTWY